VEEEEEDFQLNVLCFVEWCLILGGHICSEDFEWCLESYCESIRGVSRHSF
jgi:hypothetical protein